MASSAHASTTTDDIPYWSLSVKAIGGALKHATSHNSLDDDDNNDKDDDHEPISEKNFTVLVSPEDAVSSLYDQIEGVTGLKASQQRLIYRGRLIENAERDDVQKNNNNASNSNNNMMELKIKDIVGLGDGHTIHLVKRESSTVNNSNNNATSEAGSETASNTSDRGTNTSNRSSTAVDEALSGNGTASLLAALIGLGGLEDAAESNNNDNTRGTRMGWRSQRRNRRPHYRLTADDLRPTDPGTLEPVRQSLMTIHTMLPHAQVMSSLNIHNDDADDDDDTDNDYDWLPSPLDANRQWYRGQWIDCRDTVNQWLEATIVDVVSPHDILPPRPESEDRPRRVLEPATDPAVGAGDLEGRRRLLLEPCDVGDEDDEGGDLAGYRRRRSNGPGLKLLLIHYNGWPHRWDEWIRSDSERIRPFRTRTRHPSVATHSSPSTQSHFNESPPTHIRDEENSVEERSAILPELSRAVSAINDLLNAVAEEESSQLGTGQQEHLPWAVRRSDLRPETASDVDEDDVYNDDDKEEAIVEVEEGANNYDDDDNELDDLPPLLSADQCGDHSNSSNNSCDAHPMSRVRRRQLELLAPLLDRLGRTLIDAAPHVASLASAGLENDSEESVATTEAVVAPEAENPSTLGGLLSLLSRERRRQPSNNRTTAATNADSGRVAEPAWPVDPDYVDFATGAVNTTRGEVRSGPRSRGNNDDVAGLLGAYLAATSLGLNTDGGNDDNASNILGLGRLLRERGAGGGGGGAGIDIHIHAVVTAPGMSPTGGGTGGLGFATLGGGGTGTPNTTMRNPVTPGRRTSGSSISSRLRNPSLLQHHHDDDGLFSELYSENPAPVDPNGSPEPDSRERADHSEFQGRILSASEFSRISHPRSSTSLSPTGSSSRATGSIRASTGTAPSPSRLSRTSSEGSSRRSSSGTTSPRRGSMLGRLFRRSRR